MVFYKKLYSETQTNNLVESLNALSLIKTDLFYETIDLKSNFSKIFSVLNPVSNILEHPELKTLIINSNEFSLEARGQDWKNNAESGLLVRQEGVKKLLELLNFDGSLNFSQNYIIADLLAGNGYVNKVANLILEPKNKPQFINSDISYFMFKDTLKKDLFATWQSAENLFWLKSASVDAVLYAYGTHHITNRLQAIQEGARILKDGGRLVIHDFEEGGAMAHWFGDIVTNYSKTRHDYPHFSKQEMFYLAEKAGLKNITIEYIDDPFIIIADTEAKARYALAKYVMDLYGLVKFNGNATAVLPLIESYFGIHSHQIADCQFEVKIIRNALVCSASK